MPKARRFALIAVLVLVGGLALAGCGKGQPGVAAYVGSARFTEQRVSDMIDDARDASAINKLGEARRLVVSWLVLGELARLTAEDRKIVIPPVDTAAAAQALGVPPTLSLVPIYADWRTTRDALARSIPPVAPSDGDLREIYDFLRAAGGIEASTTFEQVEQQLKASEDLPIVVGVRNALRETAGRVGLTVNPRYQPLAGDVFGIPLVLASGAEMVTDLSTAR